jgi:hypothetical protein
LSRLDWRASKPLLSEISLKHRLRASGKRLELNRHPSRAWVVDAVKNAHDARLGTDRIRAAWKLDLNIDLRALWYGPIELEAHSSKTHVVDMSVSPARPPRHGDRAVHRIDREALVAPALALVRHP